MTPAIRSFAAAALAWSTAASLSAAPVEIIPPELRGAAQPQVAVSPSGHIHVAFGKGTTIFHSASLDGGRTFAPPTGVAELPKLALGMRRGPRIAVTGDLLSITAISHGDGNLHAWSSADGGATWKEGANINDRASSAREGLHAMASNGKDAALVTWLDLRNGGMELWRATSADGGRTWGANALAYRSPDGHICECCHPSAAMDGRGRAAVMWRNFLGGARDMWVALSNDDGKTFGGAQKLGAGTWKLNACPMDGGAVALDAAGKPLTVWRREKAVFTTALPDSETPLADSSAQPIIVAGAGGPYMLWEADGGLMFKKGADDARRLADGARFASAAPLPGGGAVVVWESRDEGKETLLAEIVQ